MARCICIPCSDNEHGFHWIRAHFIIREREERWLNSTLCVPLCEKYKNMEKTRWHFQEVLWLLVTLSVSTNKILHKKSSIVFIFLVVSLVFKCWAISPGYTTVVLSRIRLYKTMHIGRLPRTSSQFYITDYLQGDLGQIYNLLENFKLQHPVFYVCHYVKKYKNMEKRRWHI